MSLRVHTHRPAPDIVAALLDEQGVSWVERDDDWHVLLPYYGRNQHRYLAEIEPGGRARVVGTLPGNNYLASKRTLWILLVRRFGRAFAERLAPATYLPELPRDMELLARRHRPGFAYVMKTDGNH